MENNRDEMINSVMNKAEEYNAQMGEISGLDREINDLDVEKIPQ